MINALMSWRKWGWYEWLSFALLMLAPLMLIINGFINGFEWMDAIRIVLYFIWIWMGIFWDGMIRIPKWLAKRIWKE